jgi:hypothetical protein
VINGSHHIRPGINQRAVEVKDHGGPAHVLDSLVMETDFNVKLAAMRVGRSLKERCKLGISTAQSLRDY